MGRINNENLYPNKSPLSLNDTFPLSSTNEFGKTRTAEIGEIVSLIDTSNMIMPEVKLRGSVYGPNEGEPAGKWNKTIVDVPNSTIFDISKVEVNIPNLSSFENPVLLLDVYRKERKKKVKGQGYKYTRTGYRHEHPVSVETNGRVNEWELMSEKTMIDIFSETYFDYTLRMVEGNPVVSVKRKGQKRSSTKIGNRSVEADNGRRSITLPISFALRLRYQRDGVTYETPILIYFKMTLCYTNNANQEPGENPTPPLGYYKVVKIKFDL